MYPYIPIIDYFFPATAALQTKLSPFYAFEQSDGFGRLVVLILFCVSILAWTIMIEKWQVVRQISGSCVANMELFRSLRPAEFLCRHEELEGPMKGITVTVIESIADLFQVPPDELLAALRKDGIPSQLTDTDFAGIRAAAESAVDKEVIQLETRLGLLSSIVSASPFLGLLGTVWGVMMAFTGMAIEGKADIKAIAPGVSGALLTTVVGLLVAIPAAIGYNILVTQVKTLTVELDNYTEKLLTSIQIAGSRSGGK